MQIMCDMVRVGLVHCDFNEFNVIISPNNTLTAIDFPQMVSVSHANARELFERDLNCITRFFEKKMGYHVPSEVLPVWDELLQQIVQSNSVDIELHASGFKNAEGGVLGNGSRCDVRNQSQENSSADDSVDEPSFDSGNLSPESVSACGSDASDGKAICRKDRNSIPFEELQIQGSCVTDPAVAQSVAPSRAELVGCTTLEGANSHTSDHCSIQSHGDGHVSDGEDGAQEKVWRPCDVHHVLVLHQDQMHDLDRVFRLPGWFSGSCASRI